MGAGTNKTDRLTDTGNRLIADEDGVLAKRMKG